MNEDGEIKRVRHVDWDIRICLNAAPAEGQIAGHADLWRDGIHRCRIALSGPFADIDSACEALEHKAKDWIADWNSRDHVGNTDFASL